MSEVENAKEQEKEEILVVHGLVGGLPSEKAIIAVILRLGLIAPHWSALLQ